MDSYGQLITILLVSLLVPAGALTWILRPRQWSYVMRGGEVAIAFAMFIDATRRVLVIATGIPITPPQATGPIPSAFWAVFNLVMLSVISLLLWGRISQFVRHQARNRSVARTYIERLKEQGEDTSDLEAMLNKDKK